MYDIEWPHHSLFLLHGFDNGTKVMYATEEFQRTRLLKGILIFITGIIITVLRLNKHNAITDSEEHFTGRQVLGWKLQKQENCTIPGIMKFPHNLFTQDQRDNGAIVIHILASIYLCGAIAYVCEAYFVPSIEVICQNFNIRSDVAGASFMAAGSSAPEFFTAIIGTFVVEDDIGIDAIVGSAAFNVFFIIGVCPFVCEKPIQLTWYPIIRDCFCWTISIIFLIITVYDSQIKWWEATILTILYILYIIVMYFNGFFAKHANRIKEKMDTSDVPEVEVDESTFIVEIVHQESYGAESELFTCEDETEEQQTVFSPPESPAKFVCWLVGLPVITIFFLTIPDCKRSGWEKTYLITFIMGTIWMAALAYVLVWMITVIGYTIHLSDHVMGFTFLALGTSLPDLFSSVVVVKEGFGDMAIANIIGSNVFEVLVCLGFIWFVKIVSNDNWDPIVVGSSSLVLISAGLIATVVFIVVSLYIKNWILDKKFGVISFLTYFIFITFILLHDQGLLGNFSGEVLQLCQLI